MGSPLLPQLGRARWATGKGGSGGAETVARIRRVPLDRVALTIPPPRRQWDD